MIHVDSRKKWSHSWQEGWASTNGDGVKPPCEPEKWGTAENSAISFEGSRLSVYYIFLSTKENSTFKGGERSHYLSTGTNRTNGNYAEENESALPPNNKWPVPGFMVRQE